jgi:hypothetical protein
MLLFCSLRELELPIYFEGLWVLPHNTSRSRASHVNIAATSLSSDGGHIGITYGSLLEFAMVVFPLVA